VKVLMVTPSYYPIVGGTEMVVSSLTKELNKKGIKTDVLTFNMDEKWRAFNQWETCQDNDAMVYRAPGYSNIITSALRRFGANLHFFPALNFIKLANQYDIVHFHDVIDLSFPLFSFFIRKPRLFHCHTLSESIDIYRGSLFNRSILRRCADHYISIGHRTRKLLCDLGIEESRVSVIPNGVDVQKFVPGERKEKNLLLFHGRMVRRKGLHVLLQALPSLKHSVKLIISGIVADKRYCEELYALMSTIDLSRHSITHLGPVGTEQLVQLYQRSSIFICPSLKEEFGIVNIEAMACGTPVIATKVGNIPDIIDHMENGILVPPNDPQRLAEAIDYLLENDEDRFRFSKMARQKVVECFSWDAIVAELLGLYRLVLGSRR